MDLELQTLVQEIKDPIAKGSVTFNGLYQRYATLKKLIVARKLQADIAVRLEKDNHQLASLSADIKRVKNEVDLEIAATHAKQVMDNCHQVMDYLETILR